MSRFKSIIIIVLVLCGYGLSGFLLYGTFKLKTEIRLGQDMIDDLNRKKEQIYKKYQEKNALSTQLTRVKSSLEGAVSKAMEETRNLEIEKDSVLEDKKDIEKGLFEKDEIIALLEDEVNELTERVETMNREIKEAQDKSLSETAELEKRMNKLDIEKQDLQLDLDTVLRELDISRTHNAELCVIAEELLASYENKGLLASLMEKEPFVQAKRVELEKYIKEYIEKIEEQRQTQ
ncbi:MAG: hypothetical protein JW944_01955 [Deltaproteobacteria bacterium]|nr:hypothetical protein [Deltaproteobacteria bacterium]